MILMHKYIAKIVRCMQLSGNCKYLAVVGMPVLLNLPLMKTLDKP